MKRDEDSKFSVCQRLCGLYRTAADRQIGAYLQSYENLEYIKCVGPRMCNLPSISLSPR